MIFKKVLFIFLLYFLSLIQTSFLPIFYYFNIIGIIVLIINIYESPKKYFGIWTSFFGGFFLDIFSSHFFGYYTLVLILMSLLIKFVIKKNVSIPYTQKI